MALPRGYVRDPAGRFVEPGGTLTTLEATFLLGGSLPSWLVTSNSASSTATPAASHGGVAQSASADGYYRVATAGGASETAALIGPTLSINTDRCAGLFVEAVGLRWSPTFANPLLGTVQIGARNLAGTGGATAYQISSNDTAVFRVAGMVDTTDAYYPMITAGEASMPRRVGLLILPATKELVLTEGGIDNPVAWCRRPDMELGNVRPLISIASFSSDPTVKEFRLTGLRVQVWQH